jgi:hypothetical protein
MKYFRAGNYLVAGFFCVLFFWLAWKYFCFKYFRMAKSTIRISQVLAELDMAVLPDGKQRCFSVRFVKQNGETVFLYRAVKTGLKMNMKEHAMRGMRPVDKDMNPVGHIYPVWIWAITEFNGHKVSL